MAEFPNTDPFKGYSVSWTQPYQSLNEFFRGKSCEEIYQDLCVEQEIDRLEAVDRIVQNQLTYPEAEAIINKVKQQRGLSND